MSLFFSHKLRFLTRVLFCRPERSTRGKTNTGDSLLSLSLCAKRFWRLWSGIQTCALCCYPYKWGWCEQRNQRQCKTRCSTGQVRKSAREKPAADSKSRGRGVHFQHTSSFEPKVQLFRPSATKSGRPVRVVVVGDPPPPTHTADPHGPAGIAWSHDGIA